MKVLVTGANGFIGSNFCKFLVSMQIYPSILVRQSSNLSLFKKMVPEWRQIPIFYGDLRDFSSLLPVVRNMEYIFHIAGTIIGSTKLEFQEGNFSGTGNLLQACLSECPQIKRIVILSSMVAGGPGTPNSPQCEDIPSKPMENDWYGKSKHQAECVARKMKSLLPIVIVRPPTVFGPGDKISLTLFKFAQFGFKLFVSGRPRYFSIVHVDDLVKGIYACGLSPQAVGEVFNFACNGTIPYRDIHEVIGTKIFGKPYGKLIALPFSPRFFFLVGHIQEIFGRLTKKPPYFNRSKAAQATAPGQTMSNKKAKEILAWTPQYSIVSAIEHTGNWYLNEGWLKKKEKRH